jgi:hypothetical protein
MRKFLTVASVVGFTFAAGSIVISNSARADASPQGCDNSHVQTTTNTTNSDPVYYDGYSNHPASGPGPGTSTVVVSTTTTTQTPAAAGCDPVGTMTVTTIDYTAGPGQSPYDSHDSSTCTDGGTLEGSCDAQPE